MLVGEQLITQGGLFMGSGMAGSANRAVVALMASSRSSWYAFNEASISFCELILHGPRAFRPAERGH